MNLMDRFDDPWWHWKPVAAYVYMLICIVDFVIMPMLQYKINTEVKYAILKIEERQHQYDMAQLVKGQNWEPVTLFGGGIFHLSFGAILTGVTVTQGWRQQAIIGNGNGNQPEQNKTSAKSRTK